ncbi:MAG: hypothetical protein FWD97_07385 [Defluviitaleaceae bacterium]|nr:hypothetical protein [Defluviitaleaceae bacterium]
MPDFINCKHCKKLFAKFDQSSYCDNCTEVEEEVFRKVRNFLYACPNSDAIAISKATGVPPLKIFEYVKEGRVAIASKPEIDEASEEGDEQ